jgi:23S rRNA (adenine2503-C2)-methyltransferase
MAEDKKNILFVSKEDLVLFLKRASGKPFVATQINNWIYNKFVFDFDSMLNISKNMREILKQNFFFDLPKIETIQKSFDGTKKYLLKLKDDMFIEMVMIPNPKKKTVCISSQVGCARNCKFCATAKLGLIRNLTVSEILGQILLVSKELFPYKLTNIVFMGMGEPLDNYENVLQAIRFIKSEDRLRFSPRRVTISTSGVIPGINKLAEENLNIKLAVSLNSAVNEKRNEIMPINKTYPLDELKNTLLNFRKKTNFRITFEYIMIKNFNMDNSDIKALRKFVGDISCKINIIPWNPVGNLTFKSPSKYEIDEFRNKLQENLNIAITLRNSRGQDIDAACGQLVAKKCQGRDNGFIL